MSSEIAQQSNVSFPISKYAEDEAQWKDIVTAASFLPRLQLFGSNSDIVKEGKFPGGHFGLVKSKEQIEDLGKEVDFIAFSMRYKAMKIDKGQGTVLSYFNPTSPEFNNVRAASDVQNSGCMFGIEFLVWVPAAKAFATYYLNSKSSRREAPTVKQRMMDREFCTAKCVLIKNAKNSWHGPNVVACSTQYEWPLVEDIQQEAERFANPKETQIETAEPISSDARPQ